MLEKQGGKGEGKVMNCERTSEKNCKKLIPKVCEFMSS